MKCHRTLLFTVLGLLLVPQSGCCWWGYLTCADCRKAPAPDNYGQVVTAVLTAGHALQAKHKWCFPADYNRQSFFSDLQDQGLSDENLGRLRLAALDIWTDDDCKGYVLVAHRPESAEILLWDRSKSTSTIDGKGGDGKPPAENPPARTPPAQCSCAVQ
jgi:hypothetical protein